MQSISSFHHKSTSIQFRGKSSERQTRVTEEGGQLLIHPANKGQSILKKLSYQLLDRFKPTSPKAVEAASLKHTRNHVASMGFAAASLESYLANTRPDFINHPNRPVSTITPQPLKEAIEALKQTQTVLPRHIQMLTEAEARHHQPGQYNLLSKALLQARIHATQTLDLLTKEAESFQQHRSSTGSHRPIVFNTEEKQQLEINLLDLKNAHAELKQQLPGTEA